MTKLQRYEKAKEDSLLKWEDLLDELLESGEIAAGTCGFCVQYGSWIRDPWNPPYFAGCDQCPIVKAEGMRCEATRWWDRGFELYGEDQVPFCLAILCWLHSDDLKPLALESADK